MRNNVYNFSEMPCELYLSIFVILLTIIHVQLPTIGLMSRVFANGLGDRGSVAGQVMPKTQKNGT